MPTVSMDRKVVTSKEAQGAVYCPMCTHTVDAKIAYGQRSARVVAGQKCPRCSSSLDAGYVLHVNRAA